MTDWYKTAGILSPISVSPKPPPARVRRVPFKRPLQIVAGHMLGPNEGCFDLHDPRTGRTFQVIGPPAEMPMLYWVQRRPRPPGERRVTHRLYFSPATETPCPT